MDHGQNTAIFAGAHTFSLTRSWPVLFGALRDRGWNVVVAAPEERGAEEIRRLGYRFVPVPFTRKLSTPLKDVRALMTLRGAIRRSRPRLVHAFHAKPIVISAVALAPNRDVRLVCTLAGLGRLADADQSASRALRRLLWAAHFRADRVIFQNLSDYESFRRMGGRLDRKGTVIAGAGVDLREFRPVRDEPRLHPRVLMAARLIAEKGVLDYIEAARILKRDGSQATFLLAGEPDRSHPGAIDASTLERAQTEGVIEYIGHTDAQDVLPSVDIAVLPSYYGEGVPRFLLEAAAFEIPVVTTDISGCRDALAPDRTGLIVPPRQPTALASAMQRLLDDKPLRKRFGASARTWVSQTFDARHITAKYLACYAELGLPFGA